jgi:hypothetical protein
VVYTPHVILDKFRYMGGRDRLAAMDSLLPRETWEAVMYTHHAVGEDLRRHHATLLERNRH